MADRSAGLRARRKRATVNAIERAAVELALERGHSAVTVADICERADVSRSTFFNYMPSREAALFGRALHMMPAAEARGLLAGSDRLPPATAVFRVIVASVDGAQINAEVAAARNRMLVEQPDTQPAILGPFLTLTGELTAFLADWLAADAGRRRLPGASPAREAALTVALAVSAFQALIAGIDGEGDVAVTETAFADALASLAALAAAG